MDLWRTEYRALEVTVDVFPSFAHAVLKSYALSQKQKENELKGGERETTPTPVNL